jgi:hypothetical protein
MLNNIARWAYLVQVILGTALVATRLAEAVLDVLNKVANCDARKLPSKVQVAT